MTQELDLRDEPEDDHRELLFDALGETEPGEAFDVLAARDLDPHLVRYQIDNDRRLAWAYTAPDGDPRELRVSVGDPLDDELGTIDVRDLKPQRRHQVLLEIFDNLNAGEGFVLVNDHDPKPLYHELHSMHGDVIDWEYASQDDGEYRVEIVKTDDSEADDEDIVTRYDVREIPKAERHPTIHHRYGMIPEGGTMELIAPHEPQPLHREFHQQYGDTFTWDVVESEPGRCRVQITKHERTGDTEDTANSESDDDVTAAPKDGEDIEITEELDVRDLPPAERHERIFEAYEELDGGEGFVLVNDHDPKPLYHQFEAEAGPAFRWEYRQRDAGEFRVLIGKALLTDSDAAEGQREAPF